jgi:hypothetical protein
MLFFPLGNQLFVFRRKKQIGNHLLCPHILEYDEEHPTIISSISKKSQRKIALLVEFGYNPTYFVSEEKGNKHERSF